MPDTTPALPTDVASLQAMVLAQKAELATAHSGLIEQRFEIEALKARLSKLLRLTFGRSSERLRVQVEQLELALADIDELLAETGAVDVVATEQTVAQDRKPARRPLPERLPRDVVEHAAPCHDQTGACLACGGTLRPLGEDVTEILDYVPGTFRVIRHVRPKLSCRSCETITQAPAPSLPVRCGRAGAGLLAHVLVAKYCDHLPLHRQAEIYAREDVDLSRSTLADMVGQTTRLVRPLIDALARHVMSGERVHADDTVVPVLDLDWVALVRRGCGPMCVTIGPSLAPTRRRCSTVTHPTARASIHAPTCVTSAASCKPMAMLATPGSMATGSSTRPVWRTRGANSLMCTRRQNPRSRVRHWTGSPRSIGSRQRSAAVHPSSAYASGLSRLRR
jgi:transposase